MTSLLTLGGQKPLLNPLVLFFGFTSLHPINPFLPPFRRRLPPWTLVQAWQLPVVQFCVFTLDEKEWEWGMGSLVGRISIRQFSHYQYQSSLGIWPVCYYAERAVVSSVRCHMAICPFCHSSLYMLQEGRCGLRGELVPPQLSVLSQSGFHNFPLTLRWDSKFPHSSGLINPHFFDSWACHVIQCGWVWGKSVKHTWLSQWGCTLESEMNGLIHDAAKYPIRWNIPEDPAFNPTWLDLLEPLLLPPSFGFEISLYTPQKSPQI